MRKRTPIALLLRRLGRSSGEPRWQVRCRDEHGSKARLLIHLGDDGVVLLGPAGQAVLGCLDVGRLRVALREAAVEYSEVRSCGTDERRARDDRHPRAA